MTKSQKESLFAKHRETCFTLKRGPQDVVWDFQCSNTCATLDTICSSKIQVHVSQKESVPAFSRGSHRKSTSLEYFRVIDDGGHRTWLDIPVVRLAWLRESLSHF